mgnify:CR=1 FL=1|tara:strand:+ start:1269 stop:2015 length:747 start_codon:yes stop_codon:yes gene_type:complete
MAETNVPTYGSRKEYLDSEKKKKQLLRRQDFASTLKGMYAQGKIGPRSVQSDIRRQMSDKQKEAMDAAGLTGDEVESFVRKLQKSPYMEFRERVAKTRASREKAIEEERRPGANAGRLGSGTLKGGKSLVITGLRDEFGNPYRRSVDTPGAQARRRVREAERAGDVTGASALRRDPAAGADRGIRTQDDAQVDRARRIQGEQDAKKAEDAARKNEKGAKRTARQLRQELRKLKEERNNRRGQGNNEDS